MLAFISIFISINSLYSHAFSFSSSTERTPLEENWPNRTSIVLTGNTINIFYGKNQSREDTNQFIHDIRKRSLQHNNDGRKFLQNYYRKRSSQNNNAEKMPHSRLQRKKKYATKFTGLTNFIFDGVIDLDDKRNIPNKSPPQFKTENPLNKESNKKYKPEQFYPESQPKSKDKKAHEQFSYFLPVVNSEKTGFAKTSTFKPLNQEHTYNADKSSEQGTSPTRIYYYNTPNLDFVNANGNYKELKLQLQPQASETEKLSSKNENDLNETILSNDFLNSPEYEKALMLRKTNKVEMLINNQNLIKDMVKYALGKGVYPALVALEGENIGDSNDQSNQEEPESQENVKPSPSSNENHKKTNSFGQNINPPKYNHPESLEHPTHNKAGTPKNKNNNINKQFDNNLKAPSSITKEISQVQILEDEKIPNGEDDKSFEFSGYTKNQFQVSKGGGTGIDQEHKADVIPGSIPNTGENKEAEPNDSDTHTFALFNPFNDLEKKVNVGRIQKLVLLRTEPLTNQKKQNYEEDNSNEKKANNYESPDSLNQFQAKPNNRIDTGLKPQTEVKNAWTKPIHSEPLGNIPAPFSQNINSHQKAKLPPEESPENNNGYKIEDVSEKKIKPSQKIFEFVVNVPVPESKHPSSFSKPDNKMGDVRIQSNPQTNPKKAKLTKAFFAGEGEPSKKLPEGGVPVFGNLTEMEFLPLKNKNASRTILIREETEYLMDKEPTTSEKTVTLADYSAIYPPVVNPKDQGNQMMDPTMMRMHVRPFKKKVPLLQENMRKRRFGNYFSPVQEDRKAMNYRMRAAGRRVRRQINSSEVSCCYNGGTCITDGERKKTCLCGPSYTGQFCETPVDECLKVNKVCKEHEVCANHNGEFSCSCVPNFVKEGNDCIPEVTCAEFPCLNGAECEDTDDGGFICNCDLGYTGKTCSKRIPECEDSSCTNEEVCVSTQIGYKCVNKSDITDKI